MQVLPVSLLVDVMGALDAGGQRALRASSSALFEAFDAAANPLSASHACTVAMSVVTETDLADRSVSWAPIAPGLLGAAMAARWDPFGTGSVNLHWKRGPLVLQRAEEEQKRAFPTMCENVSITGSVGPADVCNADGLCHVPELFVEQSGLVRVSTAHFHAAKYLLCLAPESFRHCELLSSIDVSGLCSVVELGPFFLAYCTALKRVDLSPMTELCKVGARCMAHSTALEEVVFPSAWSARARQVPLEIDEAFLMKTPVRSFSIAASPGVHPRAVVLGPNFMSWCKSLETLDLSGTAAISIGTSFASHCQKLRSVDVSRWSSVRTKVSALFLLGCDAVEHIDAPPSGPVRRVVDSVRDRLAGSATSIGTAADLGDNDDDLSSAVGSGTLSLSSSMSSSSATDR